MHADDGAVADRVVVRLDARVALRVVANVYERLGDVLREHHLLEERARPGALLVDLDDAARRPVRVADGIRAALGDAGQQRLGSERPLDRARGAQAVSGDSAHGAQVAPSTRQATRLAAATDSDERFG